ncbi:hypothetical protein [Embleya sp. NPDC001921]
MTDTTHGIEGRCQRCRQIRRLFPWHPPRIPADWTQGPVAIQLCQRCRDEQYEEEAELIDEHADEEEVWHRMDTHLAFAARPIAIDTAPPRAVYTYGTENKAEPR